MFTKGFSSIFYRGGASVRTKESIIFWLLSALFVIACVCLVLFTSLLRTSDQLYVSEITSTTVLEEVSVNQGSSTAPAQTEPPLALININIATADELMSLPGIGEVIASRIIEYREQNGGFDNIEEIKEVSGIGDAKFEAIKDLITV